MVFDYAYNCKVVILDASLLIFLIYHMNFHGARRSIRSCLKSLRCFFKDKSMRNKGPQIKDSVFDSRNRKWPGVVVSVDELQVNLGQRQRSDSDSGNQ